MKILQQKKGARVLGVTIKPHDVYLARALCPQLSPPSGCINDLCFDGSFPSAIPNTLHGATSLLFYFPLPVVSTRTTSHNRSDPPSIVNGIEDVAEVDADVAVVGVAPRPGRGAGKRGDDDPSGDAEGIVPVIAVMVV